MNSDQTPFPAEPGGGQWHKFENPGTGTFASKTSGWTSDSFSGGLEVDFSSVVPVGTKTVRVQVVQATIQSAVYYRKSGDTNISNTPHASQEISHRILLDDVSVIAELWLSTAYKVQIAVRLNTVDISIAYPVEYLL